MSAIVSAIQPAIRGIIGSALTLPSVDLTPEQALAAIFGGGAKGAMFSSAMTALDQDNLGASPVTALNQAVGRRKDLSGLANHALQATPGARPLYSARKNSLVNTGWTGGGAAPTSWARPFGTGTSAPNGLTADGNTIYRNTAVAQRPFLASSAASVLGASGSIVGSCVIDQVYSGAPTIIDCIFFSNLPTGAVITYLKDGVSVPSSTVVTAGSRIAAIVTSGGTAGAPQLRVGLGCAGAITADIDFSRPMVNPGTVPGAYQRVNTATDYDGVGFPRLVLFDGVDDVLTTTFPAALGANCTVIRVIPGTGVVIATGQNIGTSFADNVSGAALIIIDRPLSAGETAAVMSYGNQQLTP